MASSRMRIRRMLREYNDFAHNDEKRIEEAEKEATEAAALLADLTAQWEASAKDLAAVEAIGPARVAEKQRISQAFSLCEQAIGDLDALAARYQPIIADLKAALLAAPQDAELIQLNSIIAHLKDEHQALRARGQSVYDMIAAL